MTQLPINKCLLLGNLQRTIWLSLVFLAADLKLCQVCRLEGSTVYPEVVADGYI